jgi:hypothetical protein
MPIKSKLQLSMVNVPLITYNSVGERYAVSMVDWEHPVM